MNKTDEVGTKSEAAEAPEPGKCRGCKYEPLSWIRVQGIGNHVFHEGRCRKRHGYVRAGAIAGCEHWRAKEGRI